MSEDSKLIQISLAAIAKMIDFDIKTPGKETAGLLIGEEKDGIVFVDDVRLGDQKGNAVHVEVDEEELAMAAIEVSERKDGKVIVGWVHTHPGMGAFLSPTDINTQKNYQALMPNAIAMVIDPEKFKKTGNIEDLDLKVFRVVDGKQKNYRYVITKSVEFGLNTFIKGDYTISSGQPEQVTKEYYARVPDRSEINNIRLTLDQLEGSIADEDIIAINKWLDLVDAMESGDIIEVPVEVETLINSLSSSLGEITEELRALKHESEQRRIMITSFLILIGLGLEIAFFFLIL